jgi:hypothetical protein
MRLLTIGFGTMALRRVERCLPHHRIGSRAEEEYADRMPSALRNRFGGRAVTREDRP